MDEKSLKSDAARSLNHTLLMVALTARTLRELNPTDYVVPSTAEEEAMFAQQEVVFDKLHKIFHLMMSSGRPDRVDQHLKDLIAECEDGRKKLFQDRLDEKLKSLRSKLDGTQKGTPPKEDDQNGEEK